MCVSACVCVFCMCVCVCVCSGENSASRLTQLHLESLLKKTNIHQYCSPTQTLSHSQIFPPFTVTQDPHRKESLLLLQLTQSWRKSNLNFYRGCVCVCVSKPRLPSVPYAGDQLMFGFLRGRI